MLQVETQNDDISFLKHGTCFLLRVCTFPSTGISRQYYVRVHIKQGNRLPLLSLLSAG